MKRPGISKKSKRITCRKKYKIEKKVREHNKKEKRKAKKTDRNKKRKDPGIPNAAPFKEAILKEAQERKQKMEEEKQRQKEKRRLVVQQKRKNIATSDLTSVQENAVKRQQEFDNKNEMLEMIATNLGKDSIKDNSCKAYYKEFRKVVESSDVVLQVLDARDPLGCRCTEVERSVLSSGTNKRLVFVLNKIDLVPKENVEAWLKYLRNEYPTVAFKSSTQSQKTHLGQNRVPLHVLNKEVLTTSSQCLGAANLLKLLGNYCRNNGIRTAITVGVVGFPNVGKSSLINSLKRARACNVGATPGVTKQLQEVIIDKHVKIIDCPGIVMATGSDAANVALRNCVKIETLDDPMTPVSAILSRCNKEQIMMHYNVPNYLNTNEFLCHLSKRHGRLRKGGLPDLDKSARCVLQDWNNGRITYYTHPPKKMKEKTHMQSEIVTEMAKEFDWDSLETDNQNTLDEVRGNPSQSFAVVYRSMGPSDAAAEDMESEVVAEEDDEEESHMEEDNEMTVEMKKKATKVLQQSSARPVILPAPVDPLNSIQKDGQNIQVNKSLKSAMKKNKKKMKKANALSEKLGDSLLSAMDFSSQENYDFDKDFVMNE